MRRRDLHDHTRLGGIQELLLKRRAHGVRVHRRIQAGQIFLVGSTDPVELPVGGVVNLGIGMPEGVAAVVSGDTMVGQVTGLPTLTVKVA